MCWSPVGRDTLQGRGLAGAMCWQYKHFPIGGVQSPPELSVLRPCRIWLDISGWSDAVSGQAGWLTSSMILLLPQVTSVRSVNLRHPEWTITMSHSLPPPIISKANITTITCLQSSKYFSVQNGDRDFSSGSDNEGSQPNTDSDIISFSFNLRASFQIISQQPFLPWPTEPAQIPSLETNTATNIQ